MIAGASVVTGMRSSEVGSAAGTEGAVAVTEGSSSEGGTAFGSSGMGSSTTGVGGATGEGVGGGVDEVTYVTFEGEETFPFFGRGGFPTATCFGFGGEGGGGVASEE